MNYKDYRTGEPISREQYIKNGLERGKLLYQYDCGCVIIQDRVADAYIVYCPKHEAALDMYEALREAMGIFPGDWINQPYLVDIHIKMQQALAKAEGK